MRVIVTGSRTWREPALVYQALDTLYAGMGSEEYLGLTVIHGDCPEGADRHARDWCHGRERVIEQRFPADWKTYGKRAGPIRNGQMIESGADLVLAFLDWCDRIECARHDTEGDHPSHGAGHCVAKAEAAGIEVITFWSTP